MTDTISNLVVFAIGSENKAKVRAAEQTLAKIFPEIHCVPCKVASGVQAQPMSDEESIEGPSTVPISSLAKALFRRNEPRQSRISDDTRCTLWNRYGRWTIESRKRLV